MGEHRRATEVRQVELADAALRIIGTRGIAALTTRSLAEEVGLSSGAIFRHFASLDALLDAVVTRVEQVLDATYPPEGLPPRERLERFVDARCAAVGSQAGIPRLMLSEQFRLALPKASAARLTACVDKSRAFVLGCVRDGQASGALRADVPAPALAVLVVGAVQMLVLSSAAAGPRPVEPRVVRDALFALLAPPAAPKPARSRTQKRSSR